MKLNNSNLIQTFKGKNCSLLVHFFGLNFGIIYLREENIILLEKLKKGIKSNGKINQSYFNRDLRYP
jgi:hypothetical protein